MKTEQILFAIVSFFLGMLLLNIVKKACACDIVEGQHLRSHLDSFLDDFKEPADHATALCLKQIDERCMSLSTEKVDLDVIKNDLCAETNGGQQNCFGNEKISDQVNLKMDGIGCPIGWDTFSRNLLRLSSACGSDSCKKMSTPTHPYAWNHATKKCEECPQNTHPDPTHTKCILNTVKWCDQNRESCYDKNHMAGKTTKQNFVAIDGCSQDTSDALTKICGGSTNFVKDSSDYETTVKTCVPGCVDAMKIVRGVCQDRLESLKPKSQPNCFPDGQG